jgi:uncharacterized protein YjaG (DUF416 family)
VAQQLRNQSAQFQFEEVPAVNVMRPLVLHVRICIATLAAAVELVESVKMVLAVIIKEHQEMLLMEVRESQVISPELQLGMQAAVVEQLHFTTENGIVLLTDLQLKVRAEVASAELVAI